MKNYWAIESSWFETNEQEVLKQKKHGNYNKKIFAENLARLQDRYRELNIIDYTIRKVPTRRNPGDSAVLICVKCKNGTFKAKRHNNSQWFSLE